MNGGYYCGDCCKVVVDFTAMDDQQIASWFVEHSNQNTCGIFREEMVQPRRDYQERIMRFAAALLLVFGAALFTSCGQGEPRHVVGDTAVRTDSVAMIEAQQQMMRDSINNADSIAGITDHDTIGQVLVKPSK